MKFDLDKTLEIIERTPSVLNALLQGVSDDWVHHNEGENTWSVFDVVGHLIVCEQTDFITRTKIILSSSGDKILVPIDRQAQFAWSKGKTLADLLKAFEVHRKENIQKLLAFQLGDSDFEKAAVHPKLGNLTLRDLLATWAVHDLNHLSQITRVMAKQYKEAVGPFTVFLGILNLKHTA
ncbi:DinB family protein [Panacibacter ginsenosidivorans]|uniref:DinB family protein n=1 Tax=Panacibacter ginsenosidivorans TaxID=1813871 RepID=A0A5B8VFH2_9BACT|nr:DinB family protein [Panacibacter ginsenosidivorans]QEC69286.1 DinB family protein [Panacibacter ginsenosidivorans]